MGRSKFPGKPAKLVNKKRISVINNQLNSDTQNDPSELVSRSSEPSESSASNGSISQVTKASSDATTTITKSDIAINNVEEKNLIDDNVTDKNETQSPLHSTRTISLNKNNLEQDDGGDQSSNVNNKIKIGQQEPQLSLTNTDAMKKEKNIKSSKKKTVTFRSILETSDDLNIKKKVYNPNVRAPLVPIIKKECLTRQIRYSQNDCIIQPSRLTETLQRKRLDNIDKLNSLTFKSSPYTSNFLDTDRHGHSRSSSSSSTSSKTSPEDGSGTVIGDKRFILPRRSVHSCRVIKPNKKFLDDSLNSTKPVNKKGKKKNQKRNESSTKSGSENEDDDNGKGENECVSHETQSSNDNYSESDECDIESSNQKKDSKSDYNPFSLRNVFETKEPIFSSKVILREPRLQVNASNSNHIASFGLKSGGFGKKDENPISNLFTQIAEDSTTITSSLSAMNTFNKCCTVCGTNIVNLPLHKCQKFGVLACLACRKFISKRIKKLAATGSNIDQIQCCKDGNCNITPIVKHSSKSYKIAFKTRCPSCWLQKCLKKFANLPLIYKNRLANCLPTAVCDSSDLNTKKEHNFSFNPWQVDFGSNSSPLNINQGTNIFVSNNNSNSIYSKSLSSWTNQSPKDFGENKAISSTKLLQCANPLSENNATFGSTPELILESKADIDNLKNEVASSLSPGRKIVDSKTNEGNENGIAEEIKSDDTTNQKQKLRYKKETKERNETPLDIELVTNVTSSVPNAVISPSTSSTSIEGTDKGKRQRIDLKGPRVKHVCRSAQIALGQPIATFENDLQTIEDPSTEDIVSVTADNVKDLVTPELSVKTRETKMEIAAKVIAKTLNKNVALISDITKQIQIPQPHNEGNSQKPTTRKLTRLPLAINAIANQITNKNVNAFIRKPFMHQGNQQQPQVYMPPLISIDFWENYDPAEVSQTGFGLIISEDLSIRALCFLCGSAGTDSMIFCICCCEPYHQYCVEDEYNIKHNTVFDETGLNLSSVNGSLNSSLNNQLNWVCPRCTVCYSCNMSSGSKVKCQKCQKNYHSTCLGTSKRLLGADRPLICAQCLKCKSCGTTKVTKFVGNLPMCSGCFRLRQKGNFCPLCQKCYEENDFNLKMMECGECRRWVHAKCEGLTDEQYNMLSVLPEHIEFICKNCAKNSIIAESWRDAVAVEFKSGLLSVVRLLSKSRQACALLKLSPRKKLSNCICMPIQNHRSIQFNTKESSKSRHNECESPESTQLVGINYGNDSIESIKSNIFSSMNNLHENDLLAIQSSSNQQYVKCYCSASQKQNISAPSLLEIKRKVNNNEYYSVGDFNYDMNAIITAAGCHDLLVTYKEILSETFPWYQNETKACTDALEEDMYDSNSSTGFVLNAGLINNLQERDQSIPMLPIPEDVDDYFYSSDVSDSRLCLFCKQIGDKDSFKESRMLYCGQNNWVHTNCALWSAEVFEEIDGSLQNIQSAISRGRLTKCSHCKNKGATVGCNAKNCGEQYHFICARESNCSFLVDKTVYCSQHLIEVSKKNISIESNFEVSRPIYVELDRKKKKLMDPNVIKFVIGSLKINHFGKIIPAFSDKSSILVPVDFKCSRLYWSTKEPWKIVLYRVRTYIQSKTTITSLDYGKNFTVDHTSNMETVQCGLNQISKWHDSLNTNINDYNDIRSDHRFMKNFADVEVMNEDEPQNNGDLLPPEIKDAIFEDLPHDILEGISMLDIFPKLMTYEDITNIDAARLDLPSYLSDNDDCDDNTMSSSNNRKESNENSNEWILPQTSGHVSDAMISAFNKRGGLNKELKNNKSELFSKNVDGNRIGFRTTPFAWNHKLDASNNVVVKRRKLTRSGLSFSDNGMFFNKSQERRRSLPSDELPRSKSFSWNPLKRPAPPIIDEELTLSGDSLLSKSSIEALKISQLDGADDTSDNDTITISTTVKCDKCQCTYRTNESYQRHLANCEPILSSESESDTPKSPDFQTLGQLSSINGSNLCNIPVFTMAQSHGGQQILNFNPTLGIGAIPLNSIQSQNPLSVHQTHHPQTITIQQNDLHQGNITIGQNGVPQNISNMLLSSTSSDHGQSNGHGNLNLTQSMQPQLFSNIANIAGHRTTTTTNINQYSTTNTAQIASNGIFQTATKQQQSLTNIGIPNSVNISYAQQANGQLIPIANGANNNSQIVTISSTPQSIKHMQSPVKQQLILPSPTGKKPIGSQYARLQSNSNRSKSRPLLSPKTSSMNKRIMAKTEMKTTTQQLITHPQQHNIPILSTAANNNIFVQPQVNSAQPLIVQQMSNANPGSNLVSYMTPDGQIFAIPTGNSTANTNDFKPQQTQFLTPNPLIPGAFQLQTADTNNLVLTTNAAGGLQVVPSSTLQLASTAQPQLIGTLIQPHGAAIQCGMIQSAEQVIGLGSTPTLDLVGQSAPGCMVLSNQPVYYGLETIVQNTVMSSQQFVSTAMQGVLSQNSSFSATTTQVFQASKIEPIMEVPQGYVLLNADGTMLTQQSSQPTNIITTTNPLQQNVQPLQQVPTSINGGTAWRIIDSSDSQSISTTQPVIHTSINSTIQPQIINQPVMQQKPIITQSPITVSKLPTQIVNKVAPTTLNKSPSTISPLEVNTITEKMNNNMPVMITVNSLQNKQSDTQQKVTNDISQLMKIQPLQRKSNPIKPITKVNGIKPKLIAKPVMKPRIIKLPNGSQPTHTKNDSIATKPSVTINITTIAQPIINTNDLCEAETKPRVDNAGGSSLASTFSNISDTDNVHQIKSVRPNCISINSNQQHQLNTDYNNIAPVVSSPVTSIQLPLAPHTSCYPSGIPTNVVNPIQQTIQNNTKTSCTARRPTNRVLPMQTVHFKSASPPTISNQELKLDIESNEKKYEENQLLELSPASISDLNDAHGITKCQSRLRRKISEETISPCQLMETNATGNLNDDPSLDPMFDDESLDPFDKLKAEDNTIISSLSNMNSRQSNNEVKDKITEILNQLENDECEGSILSEVNDAESSSKLEKMSEVTDSAIDSMKFTCDDKKATSITKGSDDPSLLYEIQSEDGFTFTSSSVTEIWEKVFEAVQIARKAHGLEAVPEGRLTDISGYQMLGLTTNAVKYMLEQLPGSEKCINYTPRYHKNNHNFGSTSNIVGSNGDLEELHENVHGAIRCAPFENRSEYDMFSWLASRHRKQPIQVQVQVDSELALRRGTGSNLPMAMKYRTLKDSYKDYVGVYRSHIHGRGLFCIRDIEAGEMVIEYAGELIRSTLTDKRERYYDSRGIGCYMFKIDDNLVVDATMRGNAARFINHSCEPNCYSKVVDILGHKHIIIFALRRIIQGEELTYDYKFPFEDVKIPCTCGSKKCRKYLN